MWYSWKLKSVPCVAQYFIFHQAVYASTVYIELEQINCFYNGRKYERYMYFETILMHLFNNYSLMSIPRVVEIISVELKRNCLVWTGIHLANVVQFARFPVKISTSVLTVGHLYCPLYCNKDCRLLHVCVLFTAAEVRTSL